MDAIKELTKGFNNKIEEERTRHAIYRETQVNTFNMFKEDILNREMMQKEKNSEVNSEVKINEAR